MSSTIRFDGISSGLDTTSIINALLTSYQQPITQLQQQQSQIQTQQSIWQELGNRLNSLLSTTQSLLQRATVIGYTVQPSDSTPPFTATAGPSATPGTYSILINQLATSTVARSSGPMAADIDPTALLKNDAFRTAVTAGTFTINGVSISVNPNTDTLNDVINRINSSGAGVTASLVTVDGRSRLALTATTPGGPIQLGSGGDTSNFLSATSLLAAPRSGDTITGTRSLVAVRTDLPLAQAGFATPVTSPGTLTINGVQIAYDPTSDTLGTIINKINASTANVIASYDTQTDRLTLTSRTTGSQQISLSDTGNLLAALNINPSTQQLGQNAVYSLDGGTTWQYSTSNTINDAIPGVSFTLTRTTSTPYTFSIAPNADNAVAAVKQFVDQFNSVLSYLDQQTAYNADTKQAGPLLGDSGALMLEATLRRLVTSPATNVSGPFKSLADIGISFGPVGSAVGTTNQLQLDESKLRAALATNPNAVFELFGATSRATLSTPGDIANAYGSPTGITSSGRYVITSDGAGHFTAQFYDASNTLRSTRTETLAPGATSSTLIPGMIVTAASSFTGTQSQITVNYQSGVFSSLAQYLQSTVGPSGMIATRGDSYQQQLRDINDQILVYQDRLNQRREQLIQQFAQLEALLAEMMQQSAQLGMQIPSFLGAGQAASSSNASGS